MKRLERIPPEWAASVAQTIAARVRAERLGGDAARRILRDAQAQLTLDLARTAPTAHGPRLVVLTGAMGTIQRAAASGLLVARQHARVASTGALTAEWSQVQTQVQRAGYARPRGLPTPKTILAADKARAAVAAQALASSWGAAAMAKVNDNADDKASSLAVIAAEATEAVSWRFERALVTETSDAFQEERAAIERAVVAKHREEAWFPLLVKVWDGQLDSGRCARCGSRNLSLRPWGLDFAGGDSPGQVHPNCRCVAVSVMLPIPYAKAA